MRKIAWVTVAFLWLWPLQGYSLGLGDITLKSGLNESLDAEIILHSLRAGELDELRVALAAKRDFVRAGIERPEWMQFKFSVEKKADGRHYIRVTSKTAIREPFLNFLIEANWSNGRVLRQYTLLLDPPVLQAEKTQPVIDKPAAGQEAQPPLVSAPKSQTSPRIESRAEKIAPQNAALDTSQNLGLAPPPPPAPIEVAPSVAPAPALVENLAQEAPPLPLISENGGNQQPVVSTESNPSPASTSFSQEPLGPPPSDSDRGEQRIEPVQQQKDTFISGESSAAPGSVENNQEQQVTVKRGDTAWKLATKMRPDPAVPIQAMLVALLRANPNAFFANNVNNLKAGMVLRMPSRETLSGIAPEDAIREIAKHYSMWQEYRQRFAENATRVPAIANEGSFDLTSTEPLPVKSTTKSGKKGISSAEEQAISGSQNLTLLSPTDEAVKKGGINASDKDALKKEAGLLAEQKTALKDEKQEISSRITAVQSQVGKLERLIKLKDDELAKLQAQTAKNTATSTAAETKTQGGDVVETDIEKALAGSEKSTSAPVVAEAELGDNKTLVDEDTEDSKAGGIMGLLDNPAVLGMLLIAGITLALLIWLVKRRSSMNLDEFQESILTNDIMGSGLSPDLSQTITTSSTTKRGQSSLLGEFSSSGMGMGIQSEMNVMDPLAEADVYLAYGRFQHAEELIKDALNKEPKRHELRLKLLEIYSAMKDKAGFVNVANQLHQATGGRGQIWEKAQVLGRDLVPESPLFGGSGEVSDETIVTTASSRANKAKSKGKAVSTGFAASALGSTMPSGKKNIEDTMSFDLNMDQTNELEETIAFGGTPSMEDTMAYSKRENSKMEDTMSFDKSFGGGRKGESAKFNENFGMDSSSNVIDFDFESARKGGNERLEDTLVSKSAKGTFDDGSLMTTLDGGEDNLLQFQDFAEGGQQDLSHMDLNFDPEETITAKTNHGPTPKKPPARGAASTLFDEEIDEASLFSDIDEVGTKLDLARAYIDMGDPDGAKSILGEVMEEGDNHQKQEANELLRGLG